MYEARTQEEILRELQEWSKSPQADFEGTFEYDVLASNSIEFAKTQVELEQAYKAAFGDTSWGEYLTMIAGAVGVIRRAATYAIGKVKVIGKGTVYAGSVFATPGGVRFEALTETAVEGEAEIDIRCLSSGKAGNVPAGSITLIPMSIPGITAVVNEAETYDGFDEESDEELRTRYLIKVRKPATSGNPWHYIEWALEVPGVGSAKCQRTWAGPNTVRVIIVNSNFEPASDELVQKTFEHIEQARPIGARLTVISARPVPINIEAKIVGRVDIESFKESVQSYFKELDYLIMSMELADYYVSVAQIGKRLVADGGVSDYDTNKLLLNGAEANVAMGVDEIPVIGAVNFYV